MENSGIVGIQRCCEESSGRAGRLEDAHFNQGPTWASQNEEGPEEKALSIYSGGLSYGDLETAYSDV